MLILDLEEKKMLSRKSFTNEAKCSQTLEIIKKLLRTIFCGKVESAVWNDNKIINRCGKSVSESFSYLFSFIFHRHQ